MSIWGWNCHRQALEGRAVDSKADAAVRFAKLLLGRRGRISNADFSQLEQAGFSVAEIAEIVAHVAINVLTNYFYIAMETEIDFRSSGPSRPKLHKSSALRVAGDTREELMKLWISLLTAASLG